MFSNTGKKIRRLTAIVLVITSMCMMISAQAETITSDMLFGEVKNETYENAFLGLGCTMEGWHYYTDEEMEKVNQRTKAALSNELDELVDRNIAIMMVERPDGMQNVNIQLQNVKDDFPWVPPGRPESCISARRTFRPPTAHHGCFARPNRPS